MTKTTFNTKETYDAMTADNLDVDELRRELQKKDSELQAYRVKEVLSKLSERFNFIKPDFGISLTYPRVRWDAKTSTVIGRDGRTAAEIVAEAARDNPEQTTSNPRWQEHIRELYKDRAEVSHVVTAASEEPQLAGLFGVRSNAELANKLAMTNPAQYKALRARAIREGLID